MKLINRPYGYHQFSCVINGKIVVSPIEWVVIKKHLMRTRKWIYGGYEPKWYKKHVLSKDFGRGVTEKTGTAYNIRVNATYEIVKHYNIKGYKRQNYVFFVTE